MANQLGKRYKCAKCGTEVLCTKAGSGEIQCCGEPMKTQEAKTYSSHPTNRLNSDNQI